MFGFGFLIRLAMHRSGGGDAEPAETIGQWLFDQSDNSAHLLTAGF